MTNTMIDTIQLIKQWRLSSRSFHHPSFRSFRVFLYVCVCIDNWISISWLKKNVIFQTLLKCYQMRKRILYESRTQNVPLTRPILQHHYNRSNPLMKNCVVYSVDIIRCQTVCLTLNLAESSSMNSLKFNNSLKFSGSRSYDALYESMLTSIHIQFAAIAFFVHNHVRTTFHIWNKTRVPLTHCFQHKARRQNFH